MGIEAIDEAEGFKILEVITEDTFTPDRLKLLLKE